MYPPITLLKKSVVGQVGNHCNSAVALEPNTYRNALSLPIFWHKTSTYFYVLKLFKRFFELQKESKMNYVAKPVCTNGSFFTYIWHINEKWWNLFIHESSIPGPPPWIPKIVDNKIYGFQNPPLLWTWPQPCFSSLSKTQNATWKSSEKCSGWLFCALETQQAASLRFREGSGHI